MSQKFKDCISLIVITLISIPITAFLSPTNTVIVSCLLVLLLVVFIIFILNS